jgi:hypothetical protein
MRALVWAMSISTFFNSYAGMYVTQAFCHSVIASIISDQALRAWNIVDPAVRQRFRLIVVLVPVFSFPLYQAFNQNRGSVEFRLESLLDINRWMNIEIWGVIPVGMLFLVMLALTSLIFLLQEMVPILIHTVQAKSFEQEGTRRERDPFIEASAEKLSIAVPDIVVIDDDESSSTRPPKIP